MKKQLLVLSVLTLGCISQSIIAFKGNNNANKKRTYLPLSLTTPSTSSPTPAQDTNTTTASTPTTPAAQPTSPGTTNKIPTTFEVLAQPTTTPAIVNNEQRSETIPTANTSQDQKKESAPSKKYVALSWNQDKTTHIIKKANLPTQVWLKSLRGVNYDNIKTQIEHLKPTDINDSNKTTYRHSVENAVRDLLGTLIKPLKEMKIILPT